MRLPISADAVSDCCRLLKTSAMSIGGANVGELSAWETSVGGVDVLEGVALDVLPTDDFSSRVVGLLRMGAARSGISGPERLEDAVDVPGAASQLAQKCTVGPEGERMRGTLEHFGHDLSVNTYPPSGRPGHLLCFGRKI